MAKQLTGADIKAKKNVEKIVMLTAYDYSTAFLLEKSGVDVLLVGDSLGMTVLGREDTLSVTVDEIIHHTKPVAAAAKLALVVADMPFMSYEASVEYAVKNAARLVKEGGARAVKLEGSYPKQIFALVNAGIPVMGHLGLTPQRIAELGGFKVQSKTASAAKELLKDAKELEEAGAFAVVLECIPAPVARYVTENIGIPTIGIGAGPNCDGQVLVVNDMLGLFDKFTPRFVKRYAELGKEVERAVLEYIAEVRTGAFPDLAHSFSMDEEELKALK